jgi:hypothetical protein
MTLLGTDLQDECEVSRQLRVDVEYRAIMTSPQLFMWRFIRRQKTWTSLSDLTWETAFGGDVRAALAGDTSEDHVAACLRLVSSLASTAMTALYALEQLYDHAEWNTRASLTIHVRFAFYVAHLPMFLQVLGSRAEFDPAVVYMYETMLHRIPSLTNLHVSDNPAL